MFNEIAQKHPNIVELNLSKNPLTRLPKDLSMLKNLQMLDLNNIQFSDLESVTHSLATLPNLTSLNISILHSHEALLILNNLPNLELLNGKMTKDDVNIIDIDENEVENISLNSEMDVFNSFYKRIAEVLKKNKPDNSKNFWNEFQTLLKQEVAFINQSIDNTIPNYMYASNVISSKLKIYKYFNESVLSSISTDVVTANLLKDISGMIVDNSDLLGEILGKLYPKIAEKTSMLKMQLEESQKGSSIVQDEIKNYEDSIKSLRKEKDYLIGQFEDEKHMYLSKIETLEQENRMMTQRLIKNAHEMIEKNSREDINLNNENLLEQQSYSKSNKFRNDATLRPNENSGTLNRSYYNNSQVIISTRVLTIKMLKDMINEIYQSKELYDRKCTENKMPKETMEQHMYSFLNQKYGLKV